MSCGNVDENSVLVTIIW